jgi:hypothetical protein
MLRAADGCTLRQPLDRQTRAKMPTDLAMDSRWVAVGLTVPTLVGMLTAFPVWRWGKNPTIGAILGAPPIFIATVALIGREFIEIQRFYRQCHALLERHMVCHDLSPDDFTRFAIYCFIGMLQVFLLFYMSAVVEGRRREGEFDEPWRGRANGYVRDCDRKELVERRMVIR